eukprot:6214791-Karenia_brevis.AAC.1
MQPWNALRDVMCQWGITSRAELVDWIRREGMGDVRSGTYFGRMIQEAIFARAVRTDGRAAGLEAAL